MNYMKRFAGLVCAVAAIAFFASCSKDKESGTLSFDSPAVFLSAGQTVKVGFKAVNLQNLSVTNKPTGWVEPAIDLAAQTLTITAPVSFEDDEAKTGSLVLAGSPKGGSSVSATLFVGVVNSEDLSGKPANSYIVSKPETNYLISSMFRGDLMAVLPASVDVVWQSKSGLIQYSAVDFNGLKMMDRNLGALANDNSTIENILASYGLYYQWGRKDPFIGPASYNAANGASASMYNGSGSRVYMKTETSSAESGTMDYAVRNPLTFITGVSGSEYDWLWSAHSDDLWGDTKTVNDPCPYGWRVAPSAAFDNLLVKNTPEAGDADKYGWTLGWNDSESLFIGAGRRRYDNSSIQNLYAPAPAQTLGVRSTADEAQPWEGLYWSADAGTGTQSSALHFWFEKKSTSKGIENGVPYARANGMPVRCVKAE